MPGFPQARYTTYCQSVRYVTLEEELCESLSEVPILAVASIYPNVASIRASFSILYISDSITSGDNSSDVMEDEYSEREEAQDGEGEEGEDHTLEEDFLERGGPRICFFHGVLEEYMVIGGARI